VKVECNTCHAVHTFRSPRGVAGAPARKAPRRVEPPGLSFDELLRRRNPATAQRYSPKGSFALDQVIEHPTFGMGFVSAVRDPGKIEVTFRSDVKLLIHGKA
jgi:hypothetical protein